MHPFDKMSQRERDALLQLSLLIPQFANNALKILHEASSPETAHEVARRGWGNQTVLGPIGSMVFAAVQCFLAEILGLDSLDVGSDQVTFVLPDSGIVLRLRGKFKDNPYQLDLGLPMVSVAGEPDCCIDWRLEFPAEPEAGMDVGNLQFKVLSAADYVRVDLKDPPSHRLPVPEAAPARNDIESNPTPGLPDLAPSDDADEKDDPGA